MSSFWQDLLKTFVPIFVAMDALGAIPIFLSITDDMKPAARRSVANTAMFTASVLALVFLFLGRFILSLLGITVGHFAIAGGFVLGALALKDMLTGKMVGEVLLKEEMIAVVPLGTPLVVGPATVTTLILMVGNYHWWTVLISLALNLFVTWVLFMQSSRLVRFLGRGGVRAFSKVMSLLLAAIGVSMITVGIKAVFGMG